MTNREMLEMLCRDMGELKGSVHNLENRFDNLENRFDDLENRFDNLENKFDNLENKFDNLENRVDGLGIRVGELEADMKSIKWTLENEVRRNILTIAEGHMSLDRKLDEALKVNQENEMTILRVNVLENDMRIVKNQLGVIA